MNPVRVAIGAGLLAALYLLVLYVANPVPAQFVKIAGGSGDGVGRHGGVRLVWAPPAGVELDKISHSLESHGTRCHEEKGALVIELAGVSQQEVDALSRALVAGGLEFREVIEAPEMERIAQVLGLPMKGEKPLDVEVDQWRPDEGGATHTDYYLLGDTRERIEAALAKAQAAGWLLPRGEHIAYEQLDKGWRTYVVSDEVALDGGAIANAVGSYDPNTNRPIVLLDFTRAAAEKFGELTTRITGHKLATIVGGIVKSAPVINMPIRGGRASITMGGSDPMAQERERDALVETLNAGSLPGGGTLLSTEIVAATDGPLQLWLGRLVLALGGGALVGLLAWIVVRVTRPVRRRAPPRAIGPIPFSRIFVTLLAPAAVLALSYIPVPTLDSEAVTDLMRRPAREVLNLGSVGLTPIVTAYLIAGALRAVLRRPAVNRDLVVLLAISFTALQAWLLTGYLQHFEMYDLMPRGGGARLDVVIAFAAATGFLAGIAAIIRNHGLGNGYAALIAGGWLVLVVRVIAASPPLAPLAVMLAEVVAIAVPVAVALRWRVYGAGEGALRIPTSGILPAAQSGGIVLVLAVFTWVDTGSAGSRLIDVMIALREHAWLALGLAAALAVVYAALFAWPRGLSWSIWRRAVLLSIALAWAVTGVLVMTAKGTYVTSLADPVMIALTTAFLLDAYDDLRVRRIELERVWSVRSAQDAESIERTLRDAGIPCHLACSHVRTVLGGFGAFAPVDILVTAEHAPAARTLLSSD